MFKKIIVGVLSVSLLVACSKNKDEESLSSCKSDNIINQLLQDNKQFDHNLFSENISEITVESTQDGSVLCSATLNLNSLLDSQKKVLLPIKYKVVIKNNNLNLEYVNNSKEQDIRQQWIKWAKQTNEQLVD